jgi:hypothetical protein
MGKSYFSRNGRVIHEKEEESVTALTSSLAACSVEIYPDLKTQRR